MHNLSNSVLISDYNDSRLEKRGAALPKLETDLLMCQKREHRKRKGAEMK